MSSFVNQSNNLTSLKLTFNGEIRRFPVTPNGLSYPDLMMKTLSVFPNLSSLQFSWVDDENETVIMSSNEELSEALRIMTIGGKKGYLRFEVLANKDDAVFKDSHLGTGTITHAGVMCNECAMFPLTGSRYKCSVRDNYNLCESCEGLVSQEPYPTLKIYHPDQLPARFNFSKFEKIWLRSLRHGGGNGCCRGCKSKLLSDRPRFQCTFRQNYYICEDCEIKDKHAHMMVKEYPQLSGKARQHGAVGKGHSRKRHGGRSNREKPCPARKSKGRHCWDRTSVTQAAAKRVKQAAEETSRIDDAVLQICLQESLQELPREEETSTSSIVDAAALMPMPGMGHCWDRASVIRAAALRAKKHGNIPVIVKTEIDRDIRKVKKEDTVEVDKLLSLRSLIEEKRLLSGVSSAKKVADNTSCKVEAKSTVDVSCANAKTAVKWVISGESTDERQTEVEEAPLVMETETQEVKSMLGADDVQSPSTLAIVKDPVLEDPQLQQDHLQAVTQRDEAATWAHELQVLREMGFNDGDHQLLSVLKTHVETPASQYPTTGVGGENLSLHEQQLQAVVMMLLLSSDGN